MHRPIYLTVFGLIVFSGLFAVAQVTTGTISGTVKDSTGAVIPGASVNIKGTDTGMTRTLIADSQGRYKATNLNLGNYEVQAENSGFRTEIRKGIELTVGREAVVDFTLTVGIVSEHVDVSGEAPLVDTTSSTVKGLVEGKAIVEMPLNGRSFTQLAMLEPGVVEAPYGGTSIRAGKGTKISISGTRPEHTSFLLDGLDINDDVNKSPGSIAGVMLGVETVREFSTIRNSFSAEFGRSAGGVINAVTKSGTNEIHGSVFEFLRNSALDARNFFDVGSPAPFKRNQFGGVVGGPIVKNKTFYFFGYEGLRQRLATTTISNVPDASARQGLLSGVNVGVDPAVAPYLKLYPIPNGRNLGGGVAEYLSAPSTATNEDFYQIKIDHTLSSADSFFVRYTIDNANINAPDPTGVVLPSITHSRNQYVSAEEKKILSPAWLNVVRAGFSRSYALLSDTADQPPSLSFLPGKPLGELEVTGLAIIGTNYQSQQLFGLQHYEVAENISRIAGKHSLFAGFNGKWYQQFGYSRESINGYFRFNGLRNFLTKTPTFLQSALPGSTFERSGRQQLYGFFIQDDYKPKANLTLNVGLRYEFITVPTEKYGRVANLRTLLDPAVSVGDPLFRNPSLHNFAPRFGFAWDTFSNGKTSLRGGFGIFHEQILANIWRDSINLNPPFFKRGQISPISPTQFPYPDLAALGQSAIEPLAVNFALSQPYVMQYNLTLERQFPGNTVLSLAYVGNRGVHLGRQVNNVAIPVILDGQKYFPPGSVPRNPNFGNIRFKTFDANSAFNSLQVGLSRRLTSGLMYQVSYTWGRFLDDASGVTGSADVSSSGAFSMDPYDRSRDHGSSSYDVRHRLSTNFAYELPFGSGKKIGSGLTGLSNQIIRGWQANGIVSLATGSPISVNMSVNRSRDGATSSGVIADRPDLRPGASNNPVRGGPIQYYDPSAFLFPAAGYYGNLGRNTLIGPGRATFDFSLFKIIPIRESKTLQFRAELFNLFNRANFGIPQRTIFNDNSGVPAPGAGRITTTATQSRQMQFGLKFSF